MEVTNETSNANPTNTTDYGPGHCMDLRSDTQSQRTSRGRAADTEMPPNASDYAPPHPGTRSWEVPRESVIIEKIVGRGAFGQVAQGKASQLPGLKETTKVAIKMLKGSQFCYFLTN